MNLSQISVIVYPIATSDLVWSFTLALVGLATQRGCGGAAAAVSQPRRLLAVARPVAPWEVDGEAEEEERD